MRERRVIDQQLYLLLLVHCANSLRGPRAQAVRAIGRCAVSLERAAERCINVLLELIQTKVTYVVQEAVVVIKDIFRRYPNRCAPVARWGRRGFLHGA